jgi:hypothetical protein
MVPNVVGIWRIWSCGWPCQCCGPRCDRKWMVPFEQRYQLTGCIRGRLNRSMYNISKGVWEPTYHCFVYYFMYLVGCSNMNASVSTTKLHNFAENLLTTNHLSFIATSLAIEQFITSRQSLALLQAEKNHLPCVQGQQAKYPNHITSCILCSSPYALVGTSTNINR